MKHATHVRQGVVGAGRPPAARARRRAVRWTAIAIAVLLTAIVIGLFAGAVRIPVGGIVGLPFGLGSLTEQQRTILTELRLPRVVLAGLVGAALSVSGCAYQAAFRNPLADPYLLGAAAGAGLGATAVIVLGGTQIPLALPAAAFAGALGGVGFAYLLGSTRAAGRTSTSLLLAGVAVASFLTAVQTYVQQRNTDDLRAVYAFILGRLGTGGWHEVWIALPWVAIACGVLLALRRTLEVLSLGDLEAASLGAHVARDRAIVVIAASLATAAAVAVAGLIGFVGLIVPHAVRMATGAGYRLTLGLSILFGAAFLILCDVLARTVVAPGELPIGVITALVGAPFFAFVLRRSGAAR